MFTEEVEPFLSESYELEANYSYDSERLLCFNESTYDNFEMAVCYLFNSPYEE